MITMKDTITTDKLTYEDVAEFREVAKYSFDDSVAHVIDELADALESGDNTEELEAFLGIEIS